MKLRTLAALACAMVLSLSAAGMVFAAAPDCGTTEQGAPAECHRHRHRDRRGHGKRQRRRVGQPDRRSVG